MEKDIRNMSMDEYFSRVTPKILSTMGISTRLYLYNMRETYYELNMFSKGDTISSDECFVYSKGISSKTSDNVEDILIDTMYVKNPTIKELCYYSIKHKKSIDSIREIISGNYNKEYNIIPSTPYTLMTALSKLGKNPSTKELSQLVDSAPSGIIIYEEHLNRTRYMIYGRDILTLAPLLNFRLSDNIDTNGDSYIGFKMLNSLLGYYPNNDKPGGLRPRLKAASKIFGVKIRRKMFKNVQKYLLSDVNMALSNKKHYIEYKSLNISTGRTHDIVSLICNLIHTKHNKNELWVTKKYAINYTKLTGYFDKTPLDSEESCILVRDLIEKYATEEDTFSTANVLLMLGLYGGKQRFRSKLPPFGTVLTSLENSSDRLSKARCIEIIDERLKYINIKHISLNYAYKALTKYNLKLLRSRFKDNIIHTTYIDKVVIDEFETMVCKLSKTL